MSRDGLDSDREQLLWNALDEVSRGNIVSHPSIAAQRLRDSGIELTTSDLAFIQSVSPSSSGSFGIPIPVLQFMCKLVEAYGAKQIIDPYGGNGLLGAYVAEMSSPHGVDIITIDDKSKMLIGPLNLPNVHLYIGPMQNFTDSLCEHYDAIISMPPIGLQKRDLLIQYGQGRVKLNDSDPLLMIAYMASHLNPGGFMAFAVPPRFINETGQRSVRQNLEKFGLHISALLEFDANAFFGTSMQANLAVIVREKHPDLFVARVPNESGAQDEVLKRLLGRKNAPVPSMGRLVPLDRFHGLNTLESRERYTRLAKGTGQSIAFTTAVREIKAPVRKGPDFVRCEENPCAVYLPEMGMTNAKVRQNDLPPGLKSYYQLIVDPSVVLPDYLAEYLNTATGQAWRQSVMTGTTIQRINKALMADSKLFLPPTVSQEENLMAIRDIGRMLTELKELEQRLWEEPRQASKTIDAIRSFNNEERFKDWIETLPFPLASILRAYTTVDRSPRQKYERLLYFFEAFTSFSAMIHISAFRSNGLMWRSQRATLMAKLNELNLNLDNASFGTWRVIMESMVGKLRSMLDKDEETNTACILFATANPRPLEIFTSKKLIEILQRTNHCRNIWPGHGGSVTLADATDRLKVLEEDISLFREIVGRKFLEYQLIEPQENEVFDGPIYHTHIRRYMGSNPQLEHDWVDTTVPAISRRLYMHHAGHDKVLELIPIVQVVDTPQPASYFYSNVDNGQAHLVSYHLSDTVVSSNSSQLATPSSSLRALFNELKLTTNPEFIGVE